MARTGKTQMPKTVGFLASSCLKHTNVCLDVIGSKKNFHGFAWALGGQGNILGDLKGPLETLIKGIERDRGRSNGIFWSLK